MKKIEKVFSQLSQLYEFNRKLNKYRLKKEKQKGPTSIWPSIAKKKISRRSE